MPLKRRRPGRPRKTEKVTIKKEPHSPKYSCEICSRKFDTKLSLARHENRCEKRKFFRSADTINKSNFTCGECKKKFRFKASYEKHIRNDHAKGPSSIACKQCSVRCPNKRILEDHVANVHERTIYECEHCEKKFVRRSHVMRHISQMGCDGKGISTFPCEICDAIFTRKDNLIVHLRAQHIVRNAFACKQCPYHTQSFSRYVSHFQKHHSETPQQFICDQCGQITKSRSAMVKHLEIHGEKKYECSVCGYSTFTIEVMRRHVLTHVTDRPHKCKLCAASFIQRVQLQRHMEKHHDNTCNTCGAVFKSKAKLIIHSREHMGLKKLVCPMEDCTLIKKEFINAISLQNHIVRMHLQEKAGPYAASSCEVCAKQFSSEINMRRHMSTHMLERPRRCMYCVAARAYVRGEQLVRHVRKAHPDVFRTHLKHVRQVLGSNLGLERVRKSELESILNVLDAESERILEGYGFGVLYGGIQVDKQDDNVAEEVVLQTEESPLMNEEELAYNLSKLLEQLIDKETLECIGWPDETVDNVLEKVIEDCGARAADREKWTRVQRLRENAKHLFLYVVEDKAVARMLHTHTIDQIIKHILAQGTNGSTSE